MKLVHYLVIPMVLTSLSGSVHAEWEKVSEGSATTAETFIEMDTVKQAGPMSIYRQVKVLSQGPALAGKGFSSKVELLEYDCMNSKLRILRISGYSKAFAAGDSVPVAPPTSALSEWHELPKNLLGQHTFDRLCPSGNDN